MNIFGFFIDWPNYRISLAEGFSLAELFSSAAIEQDLGAELTRAYPNGTCYVWGTGAESSINQSTWGRMDKGDLVLGYNPWDKPRCAGRVVAKTRSSEIAELLWGDADFGLIFFLGGFTELGPDRSETIYDYVGHVRNFRRVGDDTLNAIRQEFGDIEGFAKMVLQEQAVGLHRENDDQDVLFQDRLDDLVDYIGSQGFVFQPWQIATYVTALRTKPFVILAGVSGTGKSKLPQLVAQATGGVAELAPVRPNWTDSSDVLGYEDLQGTFRAGPLLRIAKAAEQNPETHYVCIIDEMNLARVEYYFAEVLSRMEDRKQCKHSGYGSGPLLSLDLREGNSDWAEQGLPPNLAIVGTVNMDETTHSFSRKVLDRAFTLEFSDIDLTLWSPPGSQADMEQSSWPVEIWYPRAIRISDLDPLSGDELDAVNRVIEVLSEINALLAQAQLQVGYRTRDEAALFVVHARQLSSSFVTRDGQEVDPLDLVLQMKILPRIVGGTNAIRRLLLQLLGWASGGTPFQDEQQAHSTCDEWAREGRPPMLSEAQYPQTAARLCLMWDRLRSEGFTSFWL